ncbi:hypothetical protein LTR53_008626 [Teratosphaeriaceae sp. CCFEE 6253]|nr:hypothetical protein LTR53_008626 [Teratosphaeriaceae sp. CCFEE 6253]
MAGPSKIASPRSETRLRRKHHKVWTGCQRCKLRHVKCDEEKPGCLRCRKSGVPCNGYNPPKAHIFELSKPLPLVISSRSSGEDDSERLAPPRPTQRNDIVHGLTRLVQAPSVTPVLQSTLLDAFLTMFLPNRLARHCDQGMGYGPLIPMSGWPSVAYVLAKRQNDSLVAHSLLCLTLVAIAVRSQNRSLQIDASRHYGWVLQRFQSQMPAQAGDLVQQHNHTASLLAACFCCSDIEYILGSWSNGDRHLEDFMREESQRISYDHCLLWASYLVVHRRRAEHPHSRLMLSQVTKQAPLCRFVPNFVAIAERLASHLEVWDAGRQHNKVEGIVELMQEIGKVISDLDTLDTALLSEIGLRRDAQDDYSRYLNPDLLTLAVLRGYSIACLVQSAAAAWRILRWSESHSKPSSIRLADRLRDICDHRLAELCGMIGELSQERYGLMMATPVLFFLDSAWIGCATLAELGKRDISQSISWFAKVGTYMASTGYRPLREPWLQD